MSSASVILLQPILRSRENSTLLIKPCPIIAQIVQVGEIPPGFGDVNIPLQISVSLPERFAEYFVPVLSRNPTSVDAKVCDSYPKPSFLPVHPAFDHHSRTDWLALTQCIEDWLLSVPRGKRREWSDWSWGCNAFWMAYTATYPTFPHGNWEAWNPAISMEGQYIEAFLSNRNSHVPLDSADSDGTEVLPSSGYEELLDQIWKKFQIHVWSYGV